MESLIWCHHSLALLRGGLKMGPAIAWPLEFCPGGSCPPPLALMPDTSFSPHKPLMPFKLPLQSWRPEGVSLSPKSMCLEKTPEIPAVSSITPTPTSFTVSSYGDLSSKHWSLGLGGLVWSWDPLLARYPSQFLSIIHGYGTTHSESLHLCPSYLSE